MSSRKSCVDKRPTADVSRYFIWWMPDGEPFERMYQGVSRTVDFPTYIKAELYRRLGRAGRGRLWISPSFGNRFKFPDVVWDTDKPLAAKVADHGGTVISKDDLVYVMDLGGYISDWDLNEIKVHT